MARHEAWNAGVGGTHLGAWFFRYDGEHACGKQNNESDAIGEGTEMRGAQYCKRGTGQLVDVISERSSSPGY